MRSISNQELAILANELSALSDSYIEKFYELGPSRFRIRLRRQGKDTNIYCSLARTINQTSTIEKAETPTSFALAVRKSVYGARIKSIRQLSDDRIILFELEKAGEGLSLILEMFGKGNLIIADKEMTIVAVYRNYESNGRSIRRGSRYEPPSSTAKAAHAAPSAVRSPRFFVYFDSNGLLLDYSVNESEKYKLMQKKEFPTMQQALECFYATDFSEKEKQANPKLEGIRASIGKQKELLKGMDSEIEENRKIGQKIFANMEMLNRLINELRADIKKDKESLSREFPKLKIRDINLKERTLTIEL
jgi:predicted ribosome quality control (RQC) complex YloA/Tae2 family protein